MTIEEPTNHLVDPQKTAESSQSYQLDPRDPKASVNDKILFPVEKEQADNVELQTEMKNIIAYKVQNCTSFFVLRCQLFSSCTIKAL